MKFVCVLLLSLSVPLGAFADEKGERTENRTGEWWRTLPTEEKYVYLTGLRDGAILGMLYTIPRSSENSPCRPKAMENYLDRESALASVTTAGIAGMLDRFYADRANATVMVPQAVFYLAREKAGESKKVLKDLLDSFRKNDG